CTSRCFACLRVRFPRGDEDRKASLFPPWPHLKTRQIVRRERCAHIARIARNANFATSDAACPSETSGATAESAHGSGEKSATSKHAVTDCRRPKFNHALFL